MQDHEKTKYDIKFEFVTDGMQKHGGRDSWSKHEVQKHYHEVRNSDYEMSYRKESQSSSGSSQGDSPWSEGHESIDYSLENDETEVLASMLPLESKIEARSRATSDASVQHQFRHHQQQEQQLQAQLMFDQQHRNWVSVA
jgi:hypothetical protein